MRLRLFFRNEKLMKTFLRENMMIVVSIALPLLVVIFFALASVLPRMYSTPPEYDLLLSHQGRSTAKSSPVKISLTVNDGQLNAMVVKTEGTSYENSPRLFRYDHLTGEVVEIDIQLPGNIAELADGAKIPIPELAGQKISEALRAPDGYEFRGNRRGGGFMTELFGGSRYRTDVSIAKKGVAIRIRLPESDYWYSSVRLVGWVIE
jgi:hypothetical protein